MVRLNSGGGPRLARLLPQLLYGVALGATASAWSRIVPLELGDLGGDLPVRRIELAGAAILAQRLVQIAAGLGDAGGVEVNLRGADHRALECDPVLGVLRIGLDRAAVVLDRRLPVAGAGGVISSAERAAGGAPGHETGDDDQHGDSGVCVSSLS